MRAITRPTSWTWLDVPAMPAASEGVLEYPMVDQEPLDRWTSGRVTLLGDAAHPMVPRGSNGAGQAILDAAALLRALSAAPEPHEPAGCGSCGRSALRTGDRPFGRIEDVISPREPAAISDGYEDVAGHALRLLQQTLGVGVLDDLEGGTQVLEGQLDGRLAVSPPVDLEHLPVLLVGLLHLLRYS